MFKVRTPQKENGIFFSPALIRKIKTLKLVRKVRQIPNLVLMVFFARAIHGLELNVDNLLNMEKFHPLEEPWVLHYTTGGA